MKGLLLGLLLLAGQVFAEPLPIIPQPASVKFGTGEFRWAADTTLTPSARSLIEPVRAATGWTPRLADDGAVVVRTVPADATLGDEGYRLVITTNRVELSAPTAAGLFYGVQTLRQMLPVTNGPMAELRLPCVEIMDRPRFAWRGLMLDESRHFFGKEIVKRLLDQMALHKLNRFHWHLTDEPAWRIEIKAFPKLTTVGGRGSWSDPGAPVEFYTQADIREIVAYAADRHIVIVPEIDMPGHATAANRAYPEFSGGGTPEHPAFTFHPAREATYQFLGKILGEVAELFPAQLIHTGGDEVSFGSKQWASDPDVQALMQAHGWKSLQPVEAAFNQRIATELHRMGRTMAGWDEIVDADVPPTDSVVFWWRHDKPGQLQKAIDRGYRVVLCPRLPCYFDFVQHESHQVGRRWGGFCSLDRVYAFPNGAAATAVTNKPAQVLGLEACVWTERIHNPQRLAFMIFPRLAALAEAGWTVESAKDYRAFGERLRVRLPGYATAGFAGFNPFNPAATPEPAGPVKKGPGPLDEPAAKKKR
jgi:hexosaminidase